MELHDVLRFFRKKLKFTQKEMIPDLDPSAYSRIESGKQEIKISDLQVIMETLSLIPEEIFGSAPLDAAQEKFKTLYFYCSRNMQNMNKRRELVDYCNVLKNKHRNLREDSNYYAIRTYFAQYWPEVEKITIEEATDIFNSMLHKSYYQHYDFVIIKNIIRLLDKKQINLLVPKIFPSRQPNHEVKYLSGSALFILLNIITVKIYEKDFQEAKKYITLGKKQDKSAINTSFRMKLKYLENLCDYLTTGDFHYMERIQEYINLLRDIGDDIFADQIDSEIKLVVHGIIKETSKTNFPVYAIRENQ